MTHTHTETDATDASISHKPALPHQGDVIYVLRTTQQHHVMLGMIADQKANIILGAFLIFITLSQSLFDASQVYAMPVLTLSAFFSLAAIFALLVIAPRFRNPKPANGKPHNLLFFGSFAALSQADFIDAMKDNLQTNEQARELIMKDIYQIGKVLDKKYRNLRLSYFSLGVGIVVSGLYFAALQLKLVQAVG